MPTYATARHGVSLAEALKEAAVTARIDAPVLHTFELYHPLGTPDGAIYAVRNKEDFSATIESTADRNASTEVDFIAVSIDLQRPEESDTAAAPELALTISNVSGLMSDALRLSRGSLDPWIIIERLYATDDTTGPLILPPLQLYVTGASIDAEVVTLRASFGDSANVSVPRLNFRRDEYPGLVR
jgi:hypothetical protein